MSTSGPDWPRLAEHLRRETRRLGLTQTEIAAKGGPSATLWRDLERGERTSYQNGTFAKIDRAMSWEPGSCETVLSGGDPTRQSDRDGRLRTVVGFGLDAEAEGLTEADVEPIRAMLRNLKRRGAQ